MAQIRRSQKPRSQEVLAWIWFCTRDESTTRYNSLIFQGALNRAQQFGFKLEPFWLSDKGMTPQRLHKILRTRGISGVLFSTVLQDEPMTLDWDWSAFAFAIVGMTEWEPVLHRAGHDYYRSLWRSMLALRELGAKRPLYLLDSGMDRRLHQMLSGGFCALHPDPSIAAELCRYLDFQQGWPSARECAKLRPDALLSTTDLTQEFHEKVMQLWPSLKHCLTMNWTPDSVAPGITTRYDLIAGAAVDLVLAQLNRNERGVPTPAKVVLLEGEWREAALPDSTRKSTSKTA